MFRRVDEVLIGAQQNNVVSDAKLCDERVDCANLNTCPAARVSKARCGNVVLAIWLDQCERRKPLDYLFACLGACEALEYLLQDEARGYNHIRAGERIFEHLYLRLLGRGIASECERPDACVN